MYCELDKNVKNLTDIAFLSLDPQTVKKINALLSKRKTARAQLNKQF